ncbi:GPI inositol-deacylase isoform X2 [Anabrus simplex]|uniref:GPI inositol-deacylase isoform X2 n=1 Tax=Anabrus simplex TaxID=316456 RepID=UPI0035A34FAF
MKYFDMAALNGFVGISVVIFICFILGLHNFLTNFEENGCEMTYMFEYPQYVKISLSPNITKHYSRYGLYAYGEGQFTERLRQMKFSGIPVLFIPGNSGSYRQVRSLASVSLRKTLNSHLRYHFDYFSVDLNDEYSGLFGGILKEQTEFVQHCIKRILQLYSAGAYSPNSVILIGHSMGGMVAKGLFLNPDFDASLVQVIITLATPHRAPVIAIDSLLTRYHTSVNEYWILKKPESLSHITLISIGGGHRDLMVRSGLTQAIEADINILTPSIPTVWLSTDHLCSMWCKELVLVIVRSLFDIVDGKTKQVTNDIQERKTVFQYHLLTRTAGKHFKEASHPPGISFDPNGMWTEYLKRQLSVVERKGIRSITYVMVRLVEDPKHAFLAAEAINVEAQDWIYACSASVYHGSSRECHVGVNLSNGTELIPSQSSRRKFIRVNLMELKRKAFTHVVLRLTPTKQKVQLNIDVHSSSRKLTVALPYWISFTVKSTLIEATDDLSVYYELAVPGLEYAWQAYLLHVIPTSCQSEEHEAVAVMEVPWSNEQTYTRITSALQKAVQLKLHTPRPSGFTKNKPVKVRLILDPACKYTVRIQSSFLDSLGQLVRFYVTLLLPYVASILLLTLRWQLLSLARDGQCVMFHTALGSGAKPYYILPVVKVGSRLLGMNLLARLLSPFLTQFDPITLLENNLDFFLLPLLLYMVAFALAYLLGLGCWLSVIFSGNTAHQMALRFLARTLTGTITWSEWAFAGMAKLPVVVAALLLALCYSTCGGLSLCVGAAFYFLKLCKMYEDYLEDLLKYSLSLLTRKKESKKTEKVIPQSSTSADQQSAEARSSEPLKEEECAEKEDVTEVSELEIKSEQIESLEPVAVTDKDYVDETEVLACSTDENKDETSGAKKESFSNSNCSSDSESHASLSELHFSFTALLLWLMVTIVNIPSVLVWAHNYRFSTKLQPDPSFMSGVVLCSCAAILWQRKAPASNLYLV